MKLVSQGRTTLPPIEKGSLIVLLPVIQSVNRGSPLSYLPYSQMTKPQLYHSSCDYTNGLITWTSDFKEWYRIAINKTPSMLSLHLSELWLVVIGFCSLHIINVLCNDISCNLYSHSNCKCAMTQTVTRRKSLYVLWSWNIWQHIKQRRKWENVFLIHALPKWILIKNAW